LALPRLPGCGSLLRTACCGAGSGPSVFAAHPTPNQFPSSEELEWDPYHQADPQYHWDGIMDSLRHAASHLPRVDAIGGSAAGVYVDNRVTSGPGGAIMLDVAREVLRADFPELAARVDLRMPSEMDKRHGQAIAAASLPAWELLQTHA
jgi:hypothetical protein